jgi:hypothetical protein
MLVGMDFLGLGHKDWPIKDTIREIPPGTPVGFFLTTFGNAIPNARALLKSGKCPIIRPHIWWSDSHAIAPLDVVRKQAPLVERLAKDFPRVKIYLSHSCEHNEQNLAEVQKRMKLLKQLAPSCIPVNCVWRGAQVKGVVNEAHGAGKAPCSPPYITSTDGIACCDIDVDKFKKANGSATIVFLWAPRFNLREVGTTEPPPQRHCIPSPEYIRAICRLMRPEGAPPKPAFDYKPLPFKAPRLLKSFAEDSPGESDPRHNKPLTITESKAEKLFILTHDGKELGYFEYYGPYNNMYRHYSGSGINLYGADIAAKALKASGSEFVWFLDRAKKVAYGPVNPAFRRGFFQD